MQRNASLGIYYVLHITVVKKWLAACLTLRDENIREAFGRDNKNNGNIKATIPMTNI